MLATMVSFAFNTMIGQVTPIAMTSVGWKFYILFVVSQYFHVNQRKHSPSLQVCNLTNAIFFWAILPETAKRPLEEMRYLFTNAPLFVPSMKKSDYVSHDLEHRVAEVEAKQSYGGAHNETMDSRV